MDLRSPADPFTIKIFGKKGDATTSAVRSYAQSREGTRAPVRSCGSHAVAVHDLCSAFHLGDEVAEPSEAAVHGPWGIKAAFISMESGPESVSVSGF